MDSARQWRGWLNMKYVGTWTDNTRLEQVVSPRTSLLKGRAWIIQAWLTPCHWWKMKSGPLVRVWAAGGVQACNDLCLICRRVMTEVRALMVKGLIEERDTARLGWCNASSCTTPTYKRTIACQRFTDMARLVSLKV